jgi:hypothetical protein
MHVGWFVRALVHLQRQPSRILTELFLLYIVVFCGFGIDLVCAGVYRDWTHTIGVVPNAVLMVVGSVIAVGSVWMLFELTRREQQALRADIPLAMVREAYVDRERARRIPLLAGFVLAGRSVLFLLLAALHARAGFALLAGACALIASAILLRYRKRFS